MKNYLFSQHALLEMKRRGLDKKLVSKVIENPEQQWDVRHGRHVLQSRISMGEPEKLFLVRVLVDIDRQPPEIVTYIERGK